MVEAKTRRFATVLALIAGLALSGCEVSQDGGEFPPPATETFTALYFSSPGAPWPYMPWPMDTLFSGTTDGTINIPAALADNPSAAIYLGTPLGQALNTLDGFSTTAYTTAPFSRPIDASTLTASTVRVVELNLVGPGTPSSTAPVRRVLAQATDYKVEVSGDTDSAGKVLKITPLKPFQYSSGANGIGYLFLVTNGVTDTSGQAAEPDELYAAIKSVVQTGGPGCAAFTDPTQNGICKFVAWQLQLAGAVGFNPQDIVVSWSYMTQSIDDTLNYLSQTVGPQPIAVQAVPGAKSPLGKGNLFVGTTQVPYYSKRPANVNDKSILSSFCIAAEGLKAENFPVPNVDTTSRFLTRYNPVPLAQGGNVTIPVLVSVPDQTATGCTKPATGWPVAIVQHGLFGDRTQALAMADSYASACFIVAAIDMALHGITDTASPFYQAANERTFNVDLVNNSTNAPTPDGKIDRSGLHSFFALIQNPLMGRDNYRQTEADIGVFAKSLANLDVTGDTLPDVDATRIHFTGLSGGAIVGIAHAKFSPGLRSATVSAPGGVLTQTALESPAFSSTVKAALAASSALFVPNSTFFNNFFRDAQTIVDPADPINHICECSVKQPLLLIQVMGDTTVPNVSTQRLVTAGDLAQVTKVGASPIGNEGVWVNFIKGNHSTLFDPAANANATAEMQTEAVTLAVTTNAGTPTVVISNTPETVVEVK